MIVFPNCKINIGLLVLGKREDGYHDLETIFYPVPINDALEAVRAPELSFSTSGLAINGTNEDNLCVKAYQLLQERHGISPVKMHLHKAIPMGAGLGGGSADGAFTLLLLNQLFQLQLDKDTLISYALELGSDCPFFIINQPVVATGRGEIMTPVSLPQLRGKHIVLVNPGIHISTGEAFSMVQPRGASGQLAKVPDLPVDQWQGIAINDFEGALIPEYTTTREIRDMLYTKGALFASMTGTGSTVYGIFDKAPDQPGNWFPSNWTVISQPL
ncbi:4-(cytidine 5'-diphospho)-2-C-methyl-D-erythritol kinase [Flavihumibacter rivuli]|uniref:4-(cytidine 5'-diphospho)-2-C-methyl-D-erythritol kinase n=1 Tax=Flavihumibacter rivuli TaxID=2838156 RepID=UPI001BDF6659|nr:4-(cytidine 5'-diphospho)-2-C-methyl-D-erythritol kinase [Flavihumibacter rivuli]ULQ57396.1 4-(cytidine 5'-diphospho)-2-C-methyl-D-erythritol kinase [Flavihumibacter rivuli]